MGEENIMCSGREGEQGSERRETKHKKGESKCRKL